MFKARGQVEHKGLKIALLEREIESAVSKI